MSLEKKNMKQITLDDLKELLALKPSTSANKEALWTWIHSAEETIQHIAHKAEEKLQQQEQARKQRAAEAWKSSIVRLPLKSDQITPLHLNILQEKAEKHGTRSIVALVESVDDIKKLKDLSSALAATYKKDGRTWVWINPKLR